MQLDLRLLRQGFFAKGCAVRIGQPQQQAGVGLYEDTVPPLFESNARPAMDGQVFIPACIIDRQDAVAPDLDLGACENVQDRVAGDG